MPLGLHPASPLMTFYDLFTPFTPADLPQAPDDGGCLQQIEPMIGLTLSDS
jgi:hypothetical protein